MHTIHKQPLMLRARIDHRGNFCKIQTDGLLDENVLPLCGCLCDPLSVHRGWERNVPDWFGLVWFGWLIVWFS